MLVIGVVGVSQSTIRRKGKLKELVSKLSFMSNARRIVSPIQTSTRLTNTLQTWSTFLPENNVMRCLALPNMDGNLTNGVELLDTRSFKKIDLHCHILPRNLPELTKLFGYGSWVHVDYSCECGATMYKGGEFFRKVEKNCYDPEQRIKECDEFSVNVQVLSTVPVYFSYWAQPQDTLKLCEMINNDLAHIVEGNPLRFLALGTVPMQSPELAVQELKRCVQELGFPGIQIGTNVNGLNLSDKQFLPFFQVANELKVCIFVHPWDMMDMDSMKDYWLPWLVGMPAESSRAICSLIFSGVMERFPQIRFVFAHGGGSFPGTIGRIEHGFNVRPDLCAVDNAINPREYLGKFWLDSLVHDSAAFAQIVELVGSERIVLGTDYPFPLGEHLPGQIVLDSHSITKEEKHKILWDNALELLGVSASRFS